MEKNEIEKKLSFYNLSGNPYDIVDAISYCINNKLYDIGYTIGKYHMPFFPNNVFLKINTATCAKELNKVQECFDICQDILKLPMCWNKFVLEVNHLRNVCAKEFANNFIFYNKEKVDFLSSRKSNNNLITLTITTCKRYELFEQTMNSFINCCLDIHLIDRFLCVDDNSSEEDRKKMKEKYPFFEFYFKTVSEKGHPQSMNIIKNTVKTPYVFHLEDDWKFFIPHNYVEHCLDIITQNNDVQQCLLNKNYGETIDEIGMPGGYTRMTISNKRYILHEYIEKEEDYKKFNERNGGARNCAYWPYFSFRPSLFRKAVLDELGNFNETVAHFESEYANRYKEKGYKSAFLESIYCTHIGRLTSERFDESKLNAYKLNNELQFHNKTYNFEKIKTVVVNLDKRKDRMEAFSKLTDLQFLNPLRFSAIDGEKLVPTEQLQQIFEGNDYNMRQGLVGCALSHLQLYIDLLKSNYDAFLILEDDITLNTELPFQKSLESIMIHLAQYDFCFIGHHYKEIENLKKGEMKIEKYNTLTSLQKSYGGTFAYLVSKEGARKFLNYVNDKGMTKGIDTMQQLFADVGNVFYTTPTLIHSICYDKDNKVDTDIQRNFNSLTIPLQERLKYYKNELQKYGNVVLRHENLDNITNTDIIFYSGSNILDVKAQCIQPNFSLENKVLIIIPILTINSDIMNFCYFRRLTLYNEFSLKHAIVYKGDDILLTSFNCYKKSFFDNIEFPTLSMIIETILNFNDEELKTFTKEFCSPELNTVHNKKIINKKLNIEFELSPNIVEQYEEKFKKLKELFTTSKNIIVYHFTKYETYDTSIFEYFVKRFSVKLILINCVKEPIMTENIKSYNIEYPERFKNSYSFDKINYDFKIFPEKIEEFLKMKK